MKLSQIRFLKQRAEEQKFVSFLYTKENGEVSKRIVRLGGDVAARMVKQGTPVKGDKSNWINQAEKEGKNGFLIRRAGRVYLRGTDVSSGKEIKHKVFALLGITELH